MVSICNTGFAYAYRPVHFTHVLLMWLLAAQILFSYHACPRVVVSKLRNWSCIHCRLAFVCCRSEKEAKFCALEKLIADDNRFAGDDVFIALAGLPS